MTSQNQKKPVNGWMVTGVVLLVIIASLIEHYWEKPGEDLVVVVIKEGDPIPGGMYLCALEQLDESKLPAKGIQRRVIFRNVKGFTHTGDSKANESSGKYSSSPHFFAWEGYGHRIHATAESLMVDGHDYGWDGKSPIEIED